MGLLIIGVLGLIFDISWMLTGGLAYLGFQGFILGAMGIVVSIGMIGSGLQMTGLGSPTGPSTGGTTPHNPQLSSASWLADPTGRHEKRYWDGKVWTSQVEDAGVTSEDPLR